jgi:hypothetical protein
LASFSQADRFRGRGKTADTSFRIAYYLGYIAVIRAVFPALVGPRTAMARPAPCRQLGVEDIGQGQVPRADPGVAWDADHGCGVGVGHG